MKPFSPGYVAFVALLLWAVGHIADVADFMRDRPEVSSTETAASTITPSVRRVALRIQSHDPGLPAWYFDGIRIWDPRSPSSRLESSAGDDPVRGKDPTAWPTGSLGEPRLVRTETVERDETSPIRRDAAQVVARRFEPDVRAILRDMQVGYGPVSGQPEMIPHTETDGTALYHVRVGPFARDDAERLCNALREVGGPCPTARE